jgi:DNA-binding PadR family transcriptional regulator
LTHYNDKILELTPEWISTNQLIEQMHGNKTLILENIKALESDGYLVMKQEGNRKLYKRDDNGDSEIGFSSILAVMVWNQNIELDAIKQLNTIGLYELTIEGKELLDDIKVEIDRAYIVMVRMNYQAKLRLITQKIADERTKRLQDHIDKTMTALTSKFNNDLIKNYFQNHVTRLEFKI